MTTERIYVLCVDLSTGSFILLYNFDNNFVNETQSLLRGTNCSLHIR